MKKLNIILACCFFLVISCLTVISGCGNIEETDTQPHVSEFIWENDKAMNQIKIQGIVKNDTNNNYDNLKMHLAAKDSNKNLLGVGINYLNIFPGQELTFTSYIKNAICPTETIILDFFFEDVGETASNNNDNPEETNAHPHVSSYIWENNEDLNWIKIQGVVKNSTNNDYDNLIIWLIVKDENGNLLGTAFDLLTMSPGQEVPFMSYIKNAICPTPELILNYSFEE